jgi:hypothetical protein
MFIRYLVSVTQVRKDTYFGLDNWCEGGNYLYYGVFFNNKYILSTVSENFAVSVSQELSDTKSKSRDLSRLVSIPLILYFSNFAIVFKLLLCLSPLYLLTK